MRTVTFGGQPFLVGIDWHSLDPTTSLSTEIRKIRQLKKKEAELADPTNKKIKTFTHGIVMKYRHGLTLGVFPSGVKRTATPVALAWLAKANQQFQMNMGITTGNALTTSGTGSSPLNWIVVEKVDGLQIENEDAFWFGAIIDGLPYAASDEILSLHDCMESLNDLLRSSNGGYTVFTSDPIIQSIVDGYPLQAQGIHALTADVKYDIKIKTLSGIPNWTLPVFGVLLLLMLAYFGYTKYQAQQAIALAQKASSEQQKELAAKQKAAQAAYIESIKQTIVSGLHDASNDINNTLKISNPYIVVGDWADLIGSLPPSVPGWEISKIECGLTNSHPTCNLFVDRKKGNERMLLEQFPSAVITNEKATITFNSNENVLNDDIDGSKVVSGKFFNDKVKSDLQLFHNAGLGFEIGAGQNIIKSITLPAKPTMVNLNAPKAMVGAKTDKPEVVTSNIGISTGALTISSGNFNTIQSLKDMVAELNVRGIVPTKITYTKGAWKLSATYFARTTSKPTIPTVKLDDGTVVQTTLPDEPWVHTLYSSDTNDMAQNSVAPSSLLAPPSDDTTSGVGNNTLNNSGRVMRNPNIQNPNNAASNPLNLPSPQQ